jgi:hypothetical protein
MSSLLSFSSSGRYRSPSPLPDSPGPSVGSTPAAESEAAVKNGSFGKGRFAKNVRMLFINGCDYEEGESKLAAQKISEQFEKTRGKQVRVHYIYLPMNFQKVKETLAKNTKPQNLDSLVLTIRQLLPHEDAHVQRSAADERAQTVARRVIKDGGRLVLFVHSGGGPYTQKALEELTPAEQGMIDVHTFGSPWLVKKGCLHGVHNHIAYGDPFPALGRWVSGQKIQGDETPVSPAGSRWNMPVRSHKFLQTAYQGAVLKIASEYEAEVRTIYQI